MNHTLTIGSKAPDFTAQDSSGNDIHLAAETRMYTLLVFLRYAGCPWCNLALHRLAVESPLLKKNNCEIVAVIESSKDNIEDNIYKRHARKPRFAIIPDPDKKLYKLYGVRAGVGKGMRLLVKIPSWVHAVRDHGFKQGTVDGSLFMVPAYFLVSNKTRSIIDVSYTADFYQHETFTRIYEELYFQE
jgi:peroxiredoxin Q/BCP